MTRSQLPYSHKTDLPQAHWLHPQKVRQESPDVLLSVDARLATSGVSAGFSAGLSCSVTLAGAGSEGAVVDAGVTDAGVGGGAGAGVGVGT